MVGLLGHHASRIHGDEQAADTGSAGQGRCARRQVRWQDQALGLRRLHLPGNNPPGARSPDSPIALYLPGEISVVFIAITTMSLISWWVYGWNFVEDRRCSKTKEFDP